MAAVDRESDERHRSRSLERDRGRRRRRHRSASPPPAKQGRKHSRSPSLEEYRYKNSAGGAEKNARKGDGGIKGQELRHRDIEGIWEREDVHEDRDVGSLKPRKSALEDDRAGARKSSKEDRKVERHSGVISDEHSEDSDSEEDSDSDRGRKRRSRARSHKRRSEKKSKSKHRAVRSESEQDESQTEGTSGESSEDSEDEYRRAKRRKRLKRKEKDERERKEERRRKKEKKRKLKEKEREQEKKKKKKEKVEKRAKGPITESWGKYGIIKEIDMWTRRPEFSAWLAEVKKVNLETLTNREEKDMFKQYMEDYNTATFPSKKYYNIDIYHRRKVTKQTLKGMKDALAKQTERTEFNDEEQRRQELMAERAKQKETELDRIKRTMMETGMGKAMREQAVLREEMQYHYRLGNKEAAEKIQRRLEPDVPGALY